MGQGYETALDRLVPQSFEHLRSLAQQTRRLNKE